jgi:hypothetical protein
MVIFQASINSHKNPIISVENPGVRDIVLPKSRKKAMVCTLLGKKNYLVTGAPVSIQRSTHSLPQNTPTHTLSTLTLFFKFLFIYLCIAVLAFELKFYTLSHCQPFFVMGFFEIRSHKLFAQVGFKPRSSWFLPPE